MSSTMVILTHSPMDGGSLTVLISGFVEDDESNPLVAAVIELLNKGKDTQGTINTGPNEIYSFSSIVSPGEFMVKETNSDIHPSTSAMRTTLQTGIWARMLAQLTSQLA